MKTFMLVVALLCGLALVGCSEPHRKVPPPNPPIEKKTDKKCCDKETDKKCCDKACKCVYCACAEGKECTCTKEKCDRTGCTCNKSKKDE